MDPYAFSHGGAAGLWQFIPATGKRFGLQRNWWYDGRRDPVAATEAALDYLARLHKRFGDWSLALAGYNAGEGAVERHQGVPPYSETRDYVVKVFDALAAAEGLCRTPADTPRRACGWPSAPPS